MLGKGESGAVYEHPRHPEHLVVKMTHVHTSEKFDQWLREVVAHRAASRAGVAPRLLSAFTCVLPQPNHKKKRRNDAFRPPISLQECAAVSSKHSDHHPCDKQHKQHKRREGGKQCYSGENNNAKGSGKRYGIMIMERIEICGSARSKLPLACVPFNELYEVLTGLIRKNPAIVHMDLHPGNIGRRLRRVSSSRGRHQQQETRSPCILDYGFASVLKSALPPEDADAVLAFHLLMLLDHVPSRDAEGTPWFIAAVTLIRHASETWRGRSKDDVIPLSLSLSKLQKIVDRYFSTLKTHVGRACALGTLCYIALITEGLCLDDRYESPLYHQIYNIRREKYT